MTLVLVGDIGGTHARLGLLTSRSRSFVEPPKTLPCSAYGSLEALVQAYLDASAPGADGPTQIAVAVAGPVLDGVAHMTNLGWRVSAVSLSRASFEKAVVINDFEALALAAPRLAPADSRALGPTSLAPRRGTMAVLGPGTGFGAAALCVDAGGSAVLVTEAGHVAFAPSDEVEIEVWRILASRFGRVSVERILSGPGLANLHAALREIAGAPAEDASAADIVMQASLGEASSLVTVRRFCSILGAVAGDFALAYGAVGGVLLAGGVAPRLLDWLAEDGFRAAFEGKGRLSDYLAAIPTRVVTHPYPALLGAAEALERGR